MEEYQTLSRYQKVKKIAPAILPIILLSVILPTADVWTDLVLITKLYKGICVKSDGMKRDLEEYKKCNFDGPDEYCNPEKVSNNTVSVCGVSQYDCDRNVNEKEYWICKLDPDQYCTPERVSNKNNNVCRLKKSSDSQYFCRYVDIWSSDERGMKKKSEYEQNIALSEAFLEAVPTTIIIFVNWCK